LSDSSLSQSDVEVPELDSSSELVSPSRDHNTCLVVRGAIGIISIVGSIVA
jgi:hypothetical protein